MKQKEIDAFRATVENSIEDLNFQLEYFSTTLRVNITESDYQVRLDSIQPLYKEACDAYNAVHSEVLEEERDDFKDRTTAFKKNYFMLVAKLKEGIREAVELRASTRRSTESSHSASSMKCPKIDLPEFDGKTENWIKFRDLFEAMVHKNLKITDIERFQYLQMSMKLPSSESNVLNNFTLCAEDYQPAWKAVCDRYNDKRKLIAVQCESLFKVKKMSDESASELRRIIDAFSSHLSSLKQMGYAVPDSDDFANMIIVQMVLCRLDEVTLKEWKKFNASESVTWKELHEFLVAQWRSLEDVVSTKKSTSSKPYKSYVAQGSEKTLDVKCPCCREAHFLWSCQQFKNLSMDDRQKLVRDNRLCLNCFSKSHQHRSCTSKNRCKYCQASHHSLLHFNKSSPSNFNNNSSGPSSHLSPSVVPFTPYNLMNKNVQNRQAHVGRTSFSLQRQTMLSTVVVWVADVSGEWHQGRALLDNGSDTNFISARFADVLGLELANTFMPLAGINASTSVIKHKTTTTVSSCYGNFMCDIECSVLPNITGNIPSQTINIQHFEIPNDFFLADPHFNISRQVDMLFNADVFYECLLGQKVQLPRCPTLIHTKFGWIIGGSVDLDSRPTSLLSCFSQTSSNIDESDIDIRLEKFFHAEEIDSKKPLLTPEEQYCEDLYEKTTTRDSQGRFVVMMPFKSNIDQLGTNFTNALRQSYCQESTRMKNEVTNKLYVAYMDDYEASGHMQEVSSRPNHFVHYLAHHGVVKMASTTTKLRPVCNASCKSETGISLNDTLCVGPTVQPESFDIIMRFRETPFIIMGDITKMYRQIWVHPTHRNFMRILWRSDPSASPVRHFQFNTVTFGTSCTPFLATRTINQLAIENEKDFPEATAIMKSAFYVDDLLCGVDSISQGILIRDQIRSMLSSCGMNLCKISSNNAELLRNLHEKDITNVINDDSQLIKALGICYDPTTDNFAYRLKPIEDRTVTKRSVLSEISRIYDPIGWIAPVVLTAKIFLKSLWLLKFDWNSELPENLKDEWNKFCESFLSLNDIKVPRHCYVNTPKVIEIHGFCDASEAAYGAVIYARTIDSLGRIQVSLLCAKSRVAPKSQKTLARLELCSATLLAKLVTRVLKVLSKPITDVTLWSDSTIVLNWLAMLPSRLSTFVGNRVAVVQDLTHTFIWRHIRTHLNPGDIVSRGLSPQEIVACIMWWFGPPFFMTLKSEWPKSIITLNENDPEVFQEVKKCLTVVKCNPLLEFIETRFSRVKVLINTIAHIVRFANNARKHIPNVLGPLTMEEFDAAKLVIIKTIQQGMFPLEYETLRKQFDVQKLIANGQNVTGEKIPQMAKNSSLISLSPFMDSDGIMRVGGRIHANRELTIDQKHQIILPYCHFATILIRDLHNKHLHPGQLALLSIVRQEFWPLKVKMIIKKVVHTCITCFRVKPTSISQFMADLPQARVTMSPPFVHTAIDYAGPYHIKTGLTRNSSTTKAYISMFKCMCTGAIHLELVTDLTTIAFLATLDRFVSRRGLCEEIFSDNATCFEGADNELRRLMEAIDSEVKVYCQDQGIKWTFTTPRAPHAGGIYESGIKSAKHHLRRTIGNESFTFEQFYTILCKIEAVLNSRPLTPISDDVNDLSALTPGHFLIGRPLIAKVQKNFLSDNSNRLLKWNRIQQIQQQFWKDWSNDYLHHLQQRPKNFREKVDFSIGNMVLVKESNLPPMKWMLGRITKIFPTKDNVVRNVLVKTNFGEKHRHVKYLCLLPLETSIESGENDPCGIEI